MPTQKQTSNQCFYSRESSAESKVEHFLSEVLNVEMKHNLKLSKSLPITKRKK
jgi:hypothetical protein